MQTLRTSILLRPKISFRSINHTLERYYAESEHLDAGVDFSAEKSLNARTSMYEGEDAIRFREEMVNIGAILVPRIREIFDLRMTHDGITVVYVPLKVITIADVMFDFLGKCGILRCQAADANGDTTLIIANSALISSMETAMMISHAIVNLSEDVDVRELASEVYDVSMRLSYKLKNKRIYERERSRG